MAGKAKALSRTTLRDGAEASVRDLIVRGDLPPGSRINEAVLAAELGISRGPLREALGGLAREGLLEIIRHRGAFVSSIDADGLKEIYEVRIALETHAIRLLGRGDVSTTGATLNSLLDEAESVLDAHPDGYPERLDFHRRLFRLLGNESLTSSAEEVQVRISLARAKSARKPERARVALNEHRAIVAALAAHDINGAVELLESHLRASYDSAAATMVAP